MSFIERLKRVKILKTVIDTIFKRFPSLADFCLRWIPFKVPLFEEEVWNNYLKFKNINNTNWFNSIDKESKRLAKLVIARRINQRYFFYPSEFFRYYRDKFQHVNYVFPSKSTVIKSIFVYRAGLAYLPFNPRTMIENHDVIDGGAASGDSSLLFSEYMPSHVYAFEPSLRQQAEMKQIFNSNGRNNDIIIVPYALSETRGRIQSQDQFGKPFQAETISIDEFAKDKNIACIKLDIEGAEFPALRGAQETIRRCNPILLICVYHKPEDMFEMPDWLTSNFPNYNFIFRDTEPANRSIGVHLVMIAWPKGRTLHPSLYAEQSSVARNERIESPTLRTE